MLIRPISENQAAIEVKECYQQIKNALGSPTLPVFFTYIGAFPEYLSYITEQLVRNLEEPSFRELVAKLNDQVINQIREKLAKSEETIDWISRYRNQPTFYYFQKDLKVISLTNVKLACVFVGLREAVKGWAVAAKKLPSQTSQAKRKVEESVKTERFIFDSALLGKYQNIKSEVKIKNHSVANTEESLSPVKNRLIKATPRELTKNLLPEYLQLCNLDFRRLIKKDFFWILRLQLEKQVLATLENFPHLIFSPFNVIVNLTQKYDNFSELLYLLSDQFPTLVIQRLMFGGYLII